VSVEEMPAVEFRQIMETNYFGRAALYSDSPARDAAAEQWLHRQCDQRAGRIAGGAQGAYAASKWALEALSEIAGCAK
jgi:NAD(P)-dependent dehydrogenase (short-subunit alcohol dehydrogenase family)